MTSQIELEVRQVSPAELNTSIAVATRALWDDPMFNDFSRDLLAQHSNLAGSSASAISDCAAHGEVGVATSGPSVAGVAAWLPPGVFPATGGSRALRQGPRVDPSPTTSASDSQRSTASRSTTAPRSG